VEAGGLPAFSYIKGARPLWADSHFLRVFTERHPGLILSRGFSGFHRFFQIATARRFSRNYRRLEGAMSPQCSPLSDPSSDEAPPESIFHHPPFLRELLSLYQPPYPEHHGTVPVKSFESSEQVLVVGVETPPCPRLLCASSAHSAVPRF